MEYINAITEKITELALKHKAAGNNIDDLEETSWLEEEALMLIAEFCENSLCLLQASRVIRILENKYKRSEICEKIAGIGHLKCLILARVHDYPWNEQTCACAAKNGHLEVLKWARENGCPWNKWICEAAAENGHLEVAKWLLSVNPDIDISINDDYLTKIEYSFQIACENGHLEIAKWLLSVKPDIDISAENDHDFIVSCENNQLEVAQWLFSIKPDIDNLNLS